MRLSLITLVLILTSCASDVRQYESIDEDYCAKLPQGKFAVLSDQLSSISDTLIDKTGTFVLEEGDQSMIFRAWLSESAEKTIDIQYFIFSADNIGLIAIDYLIRAADRGVKVRMIVDDIMVEADADELLALDAHPNLSIKIYNPTANIGKNLPQKLYSMTSDFSGFNKRMHNKAFIVDDRVVITGGRNIADEYFDYDHEYNFRDRDVLLLGEVSKDVSKSFSLFWADPLSVPISELLMEDEAVINAAVKFEYLRQYACNPYNFWPEVRDKISAAPALFQQMLESGKLVLVDQVSFVSDLPGKNDENGSLSGGGLTTDSLIYLINSAKESIYIQSPYLVTTELSQSLFQKAIERGVTIKILTNSLMSTDNLEAFSGYKRERETLMSIGVDIYEFKPDAEIRYRVMTGALQRKMDFSPKFGLHAKSMVIDQEVAVIGTFNLDPRSANLNTECIAIIHDPTIGKNLFNTMVEELKPENAWHITPDFNPDDEADKNKRFQLWLRGVVPKSIL